MRFVTRLVLCIWVAVAASGCTLVGDDLYDPFDDVRPEVLETLPGDGWIQVPPGIALKVWFSEAIEPGTVNQDHLVLYSGAHLHDCRYRVSVEADGRGLVEIEPFDPLIRGVTYHLQISELITDLAGNPLAARVEVTFRTVE